MTQDHVCVAPLTDPGPCPICEARTREALGADDQPPPVPRVPQRLRDHEALERRRKAGQ